MNLAKIESEFQERRNKNKITGQEQLLELQDQVIMRQRALNIFAVVIAVLLMMLLYILYRSSNQKRSVYQLLDQKVKERTEMLEASCWMTKRMVDAHDAGVAKILAVTKQHIATLSGLCAVALRDRDGSQGEKCFERLTVVTSDIIRTLDNIFDRKD